MLFKIALVLRAAWLRGVLGGYSIGELVHLMLLVGLVMLPRAVWPAAPVIKDDPLTSRNASRRRAGSRLWTRRRHARQKLHLSA